MPWQEVEALKRQMVPPLRLVHPESGKFPPVVDDRAWVGARKGVTITCALGHSVAEVDSITPSARHKISRWLIAEPAVENRDCPLCGHPFMRIVGRESSRALQVHTDEGWGP